MIDCVSGIAESEKHIRQMKLIVATGEMVGSDRSSVPKDYRRALAMDAGIFQLERNGAVLRVHAEVSPQGA